MSTSKKLLSAVGLLSAAKGAHRQINRAKRAMKEWRNGGVYGRERHAVTAGVDQYQRTVQTGRDLYMLRRNTHMLEKGLTMQPRRDTFALDYIERTVESYGRLLRNGETDVSSDEFRWMTTVLNGYFEATQSSSSDAIARARRRFDGFQDDDSEPQRNAGHGPHTVSLSPSVSIEDLTKLAQARRSVRWFADKPVPRETVDRAVTVAMEAPTACNRQPYRFEIVDDPGSIAKVANIPMGTRGYAHQLQGLIVIVGDLSAFFDRRDRHLIYVDASLASMGLILGLEAQGIASCSINWPDLPDREKEMSRVLGLARWERPVMLLAYGYPSGDGLAPFSAKRNIDDVRVYRSL